MLVGTHGTKPVGLLGGEVGHDKHTIHKKNLFFAILNLDTEDSGIHGIPLFSVPDKSEKMSSSNARSFLHYI